MRSKLRIITKHGQLLGLLAITASLSVSCSNRGAKSASAGNNPYSANPYYTGDSSSSASSAGSSQYPTYDDAAAPSPPASQPESYPAYTSGGSNSYPSYTGGSSAPAPSSNPYPSYTGENSYSGGGGYTGGGSTHTVASGENLYRISLKYGTTVSAIQNANGLGNTTIHPGQVLQIP
ncbi:MAG: LysM peptidoglycan-binding domain-containing protein [Verrucomicrobiales bacterium]|nr:LysM peptidoglycan-binding domain-containing protein [Verrucomicrobiales bacterium]